MGREFDAMVNPERGVYTTSKVWKLNAELLKKSFVTFSVQTSVIENCFNMLPAHSQCNSNRLGICTVFKGKSQANHASSFRFWFSVVQLAATIDNLFNC